MNPIAAAVAPAAPSRRPYPSVGFAAGGGGLRRAGGGRSGHSIDTRHANTEPRTIRPARPGCFVDVGVAQPDAEHRQAERHRDRPEAKTRCERRRADAERANRHDSEHRDAGQQAAEEHRHPDGRAEDDDRKPASASGQQSGNRAGKHSDT
jgi:hypothetical protein